jgi:Protein kinase domain
VGSRLQPNVPAIGFPNPQVSNDVAASSVAASVAPDETLLPRLPLPMAQLYRRAFNAKTPLERHLTAFYLWEAGLKLLSSTAIVEYARRGDADPDLTERLKNLARPALGHWWEFARRLTPLLADNGDAGFVAVRDILLGKARHDLPRAAGLDAVLRETLDGESGARSLVRTGELFDRLVRLRNEEIGHGAAGQRRGDYYNRTAPALLAGLGELFAHLDVLAGRRLIFVADVRRLPSGQWQVDRYELHGESPRRLETLEVPEADAAGLPCPGRLYLADETGAFEGLHPLVLYEADAIEVFFFNSRVDERRADYLCYATGHIDRRAELGHDSRPLVTGAMSTEKETEGQRTEDGKPNRDSSVVRPPSSVGLQSRRTIGEFELVSKLGVGGMGVVYRAWQPSLGRQVALKCMLRSGDPKAEARFAREIRALGRVEHPNVVKVFTSGADGDQWFYAMELVEGADLQSVLSRLSPSAAVNLTGQDWTTAISTACVEQRKREEELIAPASFPQSGVGDEDLRNSHPSLLGDGSGEFGSAGGDRDAQRRRGRVFYPRDFGICVELASRGSRTQPDRGGLEQGWRGKSVGGKGQPRFCRHVLRPRQDPRANGGGAGTIADCFGERRRTVPRTS